LIVILHPTSYLLILVVKHLMQNADGDKEDHTFECHRIFIQSREIPSPLYRPRIRQHLLCSAIS
jgi:hypothetical protein